MKYFTVSFQYSENVFCTNIAIAENVDDVEREYSKYPWVKVMSTADYEVETARAKGMPIVTCEHVEPAHVPTTDAEKAAAIDAIKAAIATEKAIKKAAKKKAGRKSWERGFFSEKQLKKFRAALDTWIARIDAGEAVNVSFSSENDKMGPVPSVSLLPYLTCPHCCHETCAAQCYAARIATRRENALNAYAKNTALAKKAPAEFWRQVNEFMNGARFFRFHVAGDFMDYAYFCEAVKAAASHPHCEVLAFTKRFEYVNRYIAENGRDAIPVNMHLLFSGWNNLTPCNPHNLPETNVIMPDAETIPDNWHVCGGNCFECACRGLACWAAMDGETIAFHLH